MVLLHCSKDVSVLNNPLLLLLMVVWCLWLLDMSLRENHNFLWGQIGIHLRFPDLPVWVFVHRLCCPHFYIDFNVGIDMVAIERVLERRREVGRLMWLLLFCSLISTSLVTSTPSLQLITSLPRPLMPGCSMNWPRLTRYGVEAPWALSKKLKHPN